jgi:hypothetical protein
MIIPDLKRAITTVMSRRSSKGGAEVSGPAEMKPEMVKSEEGEVDGRHMAAQDLLAAISEKSPQKMMEAMANFHDLHAMKASEPEPKE